MIDYKELYHLLFNTITDSLEALNASNYGQARTLLEQGQAKAEELYLSEGE